MTAVRIGGENAYRPLDLDRPPVRVESMLFSVVEPAPGHEVEYNDWYERDHQFDGALSGEGCFSNRRWVATRRLKALRFPADGAFPDPQLGAFCHVYWRQQGRAHAIEQWGVDQWVWLNEQHRIFTARQHLHSTSYWHLSTARHPGERVPLELALQHPFEGLVVLVLDDDCENGCGDRAGVVRALEGVAAAGLLGEDIPLLASWELLRRPGEPAQRPPGTTMQGEIDRLLQLAFLRGDPEALWPRIKAYADAVAERTAARVAFAGGFIPAIAGTTTYLDEL